jgi:hypothetical protein
MSSRVAMGVVIALCVLSSAFAQETAKNKLQKKSPPGALVKSLHQGDVQIKSDEFSDTPMFDVLTTLSKRHDVTFVVMAEHFLAKKVSDLKVKKSALKFDPKGLTLHTFLNVWLSSFDARYRVRPDYIEIVPLATANENSGKLVAQPAEALAALLDKLHGEVVEFPQASINEIPLFELLQQFTERHGISFVIDEECFRTVGVQDIKTKTSSLATTRLRGQTLHQFLTTVLGNLGAAYLIKGKTIEIVTPEYAARATKAAVHQDESGRSVLREPLVSAVFKEKPLNEAVASIAERYDLTVIVSPQAGDARTGFITARLLNLPADRALELVALQADLRVVRRGAAYLITSREHADGLFQEAMEKERAKIELDKFRAMPPPRPEAPPPQPVQNQLGILKLDLVPQLKPQK